MGLAAEAYQVSIAPAWTQPKSVTPNIRHQAQETPDTSAAECKPPAVLHNLLLFQKFICYFKNKHFIFLSYIIL